MKKLTRRQDYILSRLMRGIHPKYIALEVGCTYSTVRNHIRHLCTRYDLPTKGEARKRAFTALWKSIRNPKADNTDPVFQ